MSRYKDLTGQVFGKLTVKGFAGINKYGGALWLCDCVCGGTKIASANNLKKGYTKSCGCIVSSQGTDISGKVYGRLTAIKPTDKRDGHGSVVWECKCSCGNPKAVYASVSNLTAGFSTSCGCKKKESVNIVQPKATAEALKSPNSGRFETNVNAKHWILIAPDGVKYECDNLSHWARNHTNLFGMDSGDVSARRIIHGFVNISMSLAGTRKDPVYTYRGWRLESAPTENQAKTRNQFSIPTIEKSST